MASAGDNVAQKVIRIGDDELGGLIGATCSADAVLKEMANKVFSEAERPQSITLGLQKDDLTDSRVGEAEACKAQAGTTRISRRLR